MSSRGAASEEADVYLHGHHESVLRSHRWRTAENSAAYLLGHLRPGHRMLDVGCGPGTITLDLAALVAPGLTLGIDPAASVLAAPRTHAEGLGLPTAAFASADAYRLPAGNDTFDVVHAHQVLQHLRDPVAALREMRRVTRSGGVVAVRDADYGAFTWTPAAPLLDRWLALYRDVARAGGGEPDAGRHLARWAAQAGFADVTTSTTSWRFETPAERRWWGELWSVRVTSSTFAEEALRFGLSLPDELAAISEAWLRWGSEAAGNFVIPHGEVLARG